MKQYIVVLVILLVCHIIITVENDCSSFETVKQQKCYNLGQSLSPSKLCHYYNNACNEWFNECNEYAPTNNFDDNICTSITPSNQNKKCRVSNSGTKICEEWYKDCSSYTPSSSFDDSICTSITASSTNQKCIVANVGSSKVCKAKYDDCSEYNPEDNFDDATCTRITALSPFKKCVVENDSTENKKHCNAVYKECNELTADLCKTTDLYSSDNTKRCIFYKGNCEMHYSSCTDDNIQNNEEKCKNNIPIDNAGIKQKCIWSTTCQAEDRKCEDLIEYSSNKAEESSYSICHTLKHTSPKICFYNGKKCIETYKACEDLAGTDSETSCNSIIPLNEITSGSGYYEIDPLHKCEGTTSCAKKLKNCEEITDESLCTSLSSLLEDTNQKCIFKGGHCIQEFKNCDIYNEHHVDPITQTICEGVTPIYDGDSKIYKCVYKEEGSTKTCEKKEIKCEEYKGSDETYCRSLSVNINDINYNCALIDNKCVTQYKDCSTYNDDKISNDEVDRKTCESIKIYSSYGNRRCFYEQDKFCRENIKLCSEYSGENENICSTYRASDSRKICAIENKKCIEKLPSEGYIYCSDYRGTDKDICQSIQPHYASISTIDPYSKCVLENNECVKVSRKCGEAKDATECPNLKPTDTTNKKCVFKNNNCVEQYKTCRLYEEKETTIDKTTCESLILDNPLTTKCVYTAGANGSKGTCTQQTISSCNDFKVELYQSQCSSIDLSDKTKKCSFSNNICSLVAKTCLELDTLIGANAAKCEAALTSSTDKICSLKSNGNGCEEVDKPKEPDTTVVINSENANSENINSDNTNSDNNSSVQPDNGGNGGETPGTPDNNYGGKNYSNEIIFILLYLLV